MYFKSLTQPPISAGSVYTEVFSADGYVYLNYEDNAVVPEGLISVTETEWNEKKPVIPAAEPEIQVTQLDKIEANIDYLVMLI
ncbi:hypothetical protein SDC9_190324 [bioreactor metagenome]|uniref:Uncharacterized protein n=1 Tax=bioreactor metagenome TaxID=1076179 RepID=A0A645HW15_9ZZZZ